MPGQAPNVCSSVTNVCSRVKVIYLKGYDKVAFVEQGSKCLKLSCQLNWEQLGHWYTAWIAINNTSVATAGFALRHAYGHIYSILLYSAVLIEAVSLADRFMPGPMTQPPKDGLIRGWMSFQQTKQRNWTTYRLYFDFGAGVQWSVIEIQFNQARCSPDMKPYFEIRDFTQTPLCAEYIEKCPKI